MVDGLVKIELSVKIATLIFNVKVNFDEIESLKYKLIQHNKSSCQFIFS